jgi:hypothetical protein
MKDRFHHFTSGCLAMPTITRGLTIAFILAAVPRLATAGGPVQSLPKDGCWVKFFLEHEVSDPDGVNGEHTGSWTISSVGTKTVHGEKCRWIEIEEHIDQGDDGKPFTRWFKYLVHEKDLKPGGDPLSNLVEYWHKDTHQTRTATKSDNRPAMMPMFFRGTPKTATAIAKPKRVLWQQGDFTIKQAEEQPQTIRSEECELIIRDVVWKKADIPFGTAAVNSSVRLDRDGFPSYTYVRRLFLSDHGTGAKSKIPEAK